MYKGAGMKNRTCAARLRQGYSIAEIVIAMAIIVMLTVVGFTACYAALAVQERANKSLSAWNAAESVQTALRGAFRTESKDAADLVPACTQRLALALDAWVFDTQAYSYDSPESWSIEAVMEFDTQTDVNYDGENFDQTQTRISRRGWVLTFGGAAEESYSFSYRYYTTQTVVEIQIDVTAAAIDYEIGVYGAQFSEGSHNYVASGDATYTLTGRCPV